MPGDAGHPGDDDDGYMPPPDDDGVGDDDGELACFEVSVEGPALLDHARCEGWNGEPIAACDSSNSLLRTCDHACAAWCNDQGGDIRACTREELPVQVFYTCSDISPLDASCTQRFYDACDSVDGFGYTADPTALSGGCALPEPAIGGWIKCCTGTSPSSSCSWKPSDDVTKNTCAERLFVGACPETCPFSQTQSVCCGQQI